MDDKERLRTFSLSNRLLISKFKEIVQPQNFACVLPHNTINDMNSKLKDVCFYFHICLPKFYLRNLYTPEEMHA